MTRHIVGGTVVIFFLNPHTGGQIKRKGQEITEDPSHYFPRFVLIYKNELVD